MTKRVGVAITACALGIGSLLAYARWIEPNRIVVSEVTLEVPGLPAELEDLRVVFLTDLQFDASNRRERRLLDTLERLDPDLLLFGGDFCNVPYWMTAYRDRATRACSILVEMPARYAKIGVWGNNDIPEVIGPLMAKTDVEILENRWLTVSIDGHELSVAGLDDPVTGRARWDELLASPPPAPRLLLAHSPDAFAEAARRGFPVTLAGHTHGGQIRHPFASLLPQRFLKLKKGTPPYRAGLYRDGEAQLYVSRGIGMSNLKFRFLCPPEVTLVNLTRHGTRS